MRFYSDGPNIPDDLLLARDEGQVIFFCGAGVSRARAGLQDFHRLAQDVLRGLGAATDGPAQTLMNVLSQQAPIAGIGSLMPTDRVFGLLEREFDGDEVRAAVANALRPIENADLSAHKIMLDLARGPDGKVRLVTTNFDLLFEACDPGLPWHAPPALPDAKRVNKFGGLVHLHGRVNDTYTAAHDDEFVLTSADFGRAYLSEGWATNFIRSLLNGFQLVFVGYTAEDPPVQYLLEALNRHGGRLGKIHAFQIGDASEAQALWRDRGVDAIPFNTYPDLWNTLDAWAARARDPRSWYEHVLAQAQQGPAALTPHERGQVKHTISTAAGARLFAATKPPASWLCVFDPLIRYALPTKASDDRPVFDPFDHFCLDDDPPPSPTDVDDPYAKRERPKEAWDAFVPNRLDRDRLDDGNIGTFRGQWSLTPARLPTRLSYLGDWIANVADQPIAPWWAAGQGGLHPDIRGMILRTFRINKNDPSNADIAWRYIFQSWADGPHKSDMRWFELDEEIKQLGWSSAMVRKWAGVLRPRLEVHRPYRGTIPSTDGDAASLHEIVRLDVDHPKEHAKTQIPDHLIGLAAQELRRNLEMAADLEGQASSYISERLPPIVPDVGSSADQDDSYERISGLSIPFFRYVETFKRLAEQSASTALNETKYWRDDWLFSRLLIWAAGQSKVVSGALAGTILNRTHREHFWSFYGQRDLMLVLRDRWGDFPERAKARIEKRLLQGPPRWREERSEPYETRRRHEVLARVGWLYAEGVDLSAEAIGLTAELAAATPTWKESYAEGAARSHEGKVGWVGTDDSPEAIRNEPIRNILVRAAELGTRTFDSWVERRPLDGLVNERPIRVFRALVLEAKKGEYPEWAWRAFLSKREGDAERLLVAVAQRVCQFPASAITGLIYSITNWLRSVGKRLARFSPQTFDNVWEVIVAAIREAPEAAGSSIIHSSNHDWVTSAINSPGGRLAETLMDLDEHIPGEDGFSPRWLAKVEELLTVPGDVARHAAVVFLFNLSWFFFHAREWTENWLIAPADQGGVEAEVFWAGFFWNGKVPATPLYRRLKTALLRVATDDLAHKHTERVAGFLLAGWGSFDAADGNRHVLDGEFREVLLAANDDFRRQVLWFLDRWSRDSERDWQNQAIALLTTVWPRQRSVRSPEISARLCELAFGAKDNFPAMVDAVVPLLTTVSSDSLSFFSAGRSDWDVAHEHPAALLKLMHAALPEEATKWPYGSEALVEKLIQVPALTADARMVDLRRRLAAR